MLNERPEKPEDGNQFTIYSDFRTNYTMTRIKSYLFFPWQDGVFMIL